jgi:hypothetical protein
VQGFGRSWLVTVLVLSVLWFHPALRVVVVNALGLHTTIAVVSGLGALGIRQLQHSGVARSAAAVVLLAGCWAVAVVWQYLNRDRAPSVDWPLIVVGGLGVVLVPVAVAFFYGTRRGAESAGIATMLGQVLSLAFAAAPLSTIVALIVVSVVVGESV